MAKTVDWILLMILADSFPLRTNCIFDLPMVQRAQGDPLQLLPSHQILLFRLWLHRHQRNHDDPVLETNSNLVIVTLNAELQLSL